MKLSPNIEALLRERCRKRKAAAIRCAIEALTDLRAKNVSAYVIGSLVSGAFMQHSDVDYLIDGHVASLERGRIEALIARAMSGSNIPHDVIYADDLRPEFAQDFHHVKADASRLSQLAEETGKA